MKKLSKIKIIEEGRTISGEEMKSLIGGVVTTCSGGTYSSCTDYAYESCTLNPSAAGYSSSGGSGGFCSTGYTYTSCTAKYCSNNGGF